MKKILTMIMSVLICLVANAQEVHGYSMAIANELSEQNFIVLESGYGTMKDADNKDFDVFVVKMAAPNFYEEETTRFIITSVLSWRNNVKMVFPWTKKSYGSRADYCVGDDTELYVAVSNNGYEIMIVEFINSNLKKALHKTPKKKASGKSKRRSRKH